ncbi:Gamma-aminobutyric acid receptor subunit beta [Sarcoptes scabiei]|uniref:Gamma-aminobutyric acid receptor subunit beta n=1 Tax=Sarcoptes scabiei TaxID=52283 RepID=A0A834R8N5_SARSC|nr:Gamma-aminobutyric acid receptor subunit beta [Sarcoptes scabiei]
MVIRMKLIKTMIMIMVAIKIIEFKMKRKCDYNYDQFDHNHLHHQKFSQQKHQQHHHWRKKRKRYRDKIFSLLLVYLNLPFITSSSSSASASAETSSSISFAINQQSNSMTKIKRSSSNNVSSSSSPSSSSLISSPSSSLSVLNESSKTSKMNDEEMFRTEMKFNDENMDHDGINNRIHSFGSPMNAPKQTAIGQNITRILNAFFDSGYDKRVRPNYAGPPVQVGVTMHIISISSISAVQMDFTSDFYFRQSWRDQRLSFRPQPGIEALYVGAEVSEKIWVPDTFFANEKAAQFHMATTPNTFIRIKSNGELPMNLQYFPMDRQSCTIEVESYGYSMADIQYKWGIDGQGSDVVLAKNLELPQFKVYKHLQRRKVEVLSTGNYSRLVCEIEFVRSMGYYLIQIYIPASLIVIISWVSFWLHRNASPARVQLGVTTVLTMTTLMSSTNAAMPKISYIKSIDVFLGTCFVMVFAALLEYATVGYMGKRIAMRKSRTQQIVRMLNEHREKCIAAAAAAAAANESKNNLIDGSNQRYNDDALGNDSCTALTVRRHGALIRTASLYPNMEQLDELESLQKHSKRGYRTNEMSGHRSVPPPHQSRSFNAARQFERTASLKSRAFTIDNGDDIETGPNFNDDLNVFVAAGSSNTAVSGGSSSYYPLESHHSLTGISGVGGSSDRFHGNRFRGNYLGLDSTDMKNLADRAFFPSSYYLKNQNTLFGVCPSDIDKYSRVVFPVCFLCFNLMYWIIYMHISEFLIEDQQLDGINLGDG